MNVAVVGAGSWGTALAKVLHGNGHQVTIWARDAAALQELRAGRNERYLPGVPLPHDWICEPDLNRAIAGQYDLTVNWRDVEWFKSAWGGPVLLKGILSVEDAKLAAAHGADGVIVSNHGGRQLEGAVSAVHALPAIADAVGGRLEVVLDGGIRRGADVVRARALGARACMIGRAWLYGLASAGQAGVERALEILRDEIDITLTLLGRPTLAEVDRDAIERVG